MTINRYKKSRVLEVQISLNKPQIRKALIYSKIEIISIEVVLTFIPWYVSKFSLLIVCSDAMITRHVDAEATLGISINGVANKCSRERWLMY